MSSKILYSILIMAVSTYLTKALPFIFLKKLKETPIFNLFQKAIPLIIIVNLIIYSLKDTPFNKSPFGAYELLSCLIVIFLHLWKRQFLVSILVGTFFYMFLVQH